MVQILQPTLCHLIVKKVPFNPKSRKACKYLKHKTQVQLKIKAKTRHLWNKIIISSTIAFRDKGSSINFRTIQRPIQIWVTIATIIRIIIPIILIWDRITWHIKLTITFLKWNQTGRVSIQIPLTIKIILKLLTFQTNKTNSIKALIRILIKAWHHNRLYIQIIHIIKTQIRATFNHHNRSQLSLLLLLHLVNLRSVQQHSNQNDIFGDILKI